MTVAHVGRRIALRAGDLTIVDRASPVLIEREGGWSARLLNLGDRRIASRIEDRGQWIATPLDGGSKLAALLKQVWSIGDEACALAIGDDIIDTRFMDLVVELGGRLLAQLTDGRLPSQAVTTVERARALISARLSDPTFDVGTLAASMKVTPRYLSSLFAQLGTTTSRSILEARLAHGRKLLLDPANANRQIASIASACGFADQGHFTRRFRLEEGVTPGQFRRRPRQIVTNRAHDLDMAEVPG